MKYVIGFDGGGTKTRCVLGDLQGNIIADHIDGPSNHQIIGPEKTKNVLKTLYKKTLESSNINEDDISFVFLGLSGADLPEDFDLLNTICKNIFRHIPFEVVNDSWIIMRSGLKKPHGAVSIYGTGANAAAINKDGQMSILRALNYNLGGAGGGPEIARAALHFAFRANEKTYQSTRLETEIPKLLGYKDIHHLLKSMYPENKLSTDDFNKITPLVFELASNGDEVSIEILQEKGITHGQMINGVLEQSNMIDEEFSVVLGGSVFKGQGNTFINSIKETVHSKSPKAKFIMSKLEPVAGAYLFALDRINTHLDDQAYHRLFDFLQIK